jgi:hypothetical protein
MGDRFGWRLATSNIKAAGDTSNLQRGREINRRFRPLLRTGEKRKILHEQPKQRRQTIQVVAEPGSRRAGEKAIGGSAGAGQTPAQLEREEDILQLRAKIGAEKLMPLLALQVVEIKRGTVGARSDRDDAPPAGAARMRSSRRFVNRNGAR